MTDILIRPACADDVPRLADWAAAMALETESLRLDPARLRRGIERVLAEPQRGGYWLAERDGTPAGTLMLTYEWSDWRCADWWWIQSVYVAPAHRRRGVFAALYRHVHHAAQAQGEAVCGLRLYVERDNLTAQRTYAGLGMDESHYRLFEAPLPWLRRALG